MKPQEALTFFQRINRANSLNELRKINPGLFFSFFSFSSFFLICPSFHITQQKGPSIFRYLDLNPKPFHSPN